MKTILITGCQGQVGWELMRTLASLGRVVACDKKNCDFSQPQQCVTLVRTLKPSLIVNAAAYTAVDSAEKDSEMAMQVNAVTPGILAEEAKKLKALFIHFSTDYVFDGVSQKPYHELDIPNPINMYGRSKFQGEMNIQEVGGAYLIVRTSWVYSCRGHNFFLTMLKLAREKKILKIINDQIGTPTWSRMLAEITAQMAAMLLHQQSKFNLPWGIYHATPQGFTSWYKFANAIFSSDLISGCQTPPELIPISSHEYPSLAARPQNSVLKCDKLYQTFGLQMPDWEEVFQLFLESMFASTKALKGLWIKNIL